MGSLRTLLKRDKIIGPYDCPVCRNSSMVWSLHSTEWDSEGQEIGSKSEFICKCGKAWEIHYSRYGEVING